MQKSSLNPAIIDELFASASNMSPAKASPMVHPVKFAQPARGRTAQFRPSSLTSRVAMAPPQGVANKIHRLLPRR